MAPERGIEGLAQALDDGEARLVVADIDWDRFVPVYTLHRPSPLLTALPEATRAQAEDEQGDTARPAPEVARLRARLAGAPSDFERQTILLEVVREHAAAVLGHADAAAVEPDTTFLEQGFNSLSAVELRRRLAQVTGLRLTGPLAFDHPTPVKAAGYLGERFAADGARQDAPDPVRPARFVLPTPPEPRDDIPVGTPTHTEAGVPGPAVTQTEAGVPGPAVTQTEAGAPGPAPTHTQATAPGTAPPQLPDVGAAAPPSLPALYLRARREGRGADAMRMITGLAGFRPSFTDPAELESVPPLVPVVRHPADPGTPTLVCLPSFGASADAQEFARLAHGFRGRWRILAAAVPGYVPGEPLAAGPEALLDLCARTVLDTPEVAAGDGPFVLVGYSSGGLVAHALAARLADRGRVPAALVLLDTFTPEIAGVPDDLLDALPAAVLANTPDAGAGGGVGGDDWLTALAHYYAFDWRPHLPHVTGLPTLLVRHADGTDDPFAAPWTYAGDVSRAAVPGDHFSMIGAHAETTAQAVEDWLAAHFTLTQDGNDD
jgi:thioesterase domain-containing protein